MVIMLLTLLHRAFSTLIADKQFSTLGVVLLAVLGRVARIVGVGEGEGEDAERDVDSAARDARLAEGGNSGVVGEDLGEVVGRGTITTTATAQEEGGDVHPMVEGDSAKLDLGLGIGGSTALAEKRVSDVATSRESDEMDAAANKDPPPRPKKKRKKGNAIDELFSELS